MKHLLTEEEEVEEDAPKDEFLGDNIFIVLVLYCT